jgi:hypothetical protein
VLRLGMRLCPLNINYKQNRYVARSKLSHFSHVIRRPTRPPRALRQKTTVRAAAQFCFVETKLLTHAKATKSLTDYDAKATA